MTEQQGMLNPGHEESIGGVVPEAPKPKARPSRKKKEVNYKTEFTKLMKEHDELQEKLGISESKAETYFQKYLNVQKQLDVQKDMVNQAKYHMSQAIVSAMSSFDMSVR